MSIRIMRSNNNRSEFLSSYKAKGKRRLNATGPKQQDVYIDARNLWKASTISQQKQYESIRSSDLLSNNRKMTFLKFNYRNTQERNLCYPDVFRLTARKSEQPYTYQTKARIKKVNMGLHDLSLRVAQQIKENIFQAEKDWLKQYHEIEHKKDEPHKKKAYVPLGTMNVNDLWGEKQLQQSLGFLPCKRDRPKMLKFYSTNIKLKKYKTEGIEMCQADFI